MIANPCRLRVATPADTASVTAVLASAYPTLLQADYDPAVLAVTLPFMTVANADLLASGTYYVQETPHRQIVACGGWTHTEPGTNSTENGVAHIRHFATHVDWLRQGLAAGIFNHCRTVALGCDVHTFRCFSSLSAESFYAALGFYVAERTTVAIGGDMRFATVKMVWTDKADGNREAPSCS